jgi:putative membrane protein
MVVHAGAPLEPHDLWRAWSAEPLSVLLLAAAAVLFGHGVQSVWRAAGVGRAVPKPNVLLFASGWLILALSLLSPIHALGGVLFSAHMAQHELLMTVAAPLLVLGRPLIPLVWALPPRWRRTTGRWARTRIAAAIWGGLTRPTVAFLVHAIAIWAWHIPTLYDRAVVSELAHGLQHASFFGTALLFWWAVLKPSGSREKTAVSIALLFATLLHTGALGAVLTLTTRLLYPVYGATTSPWGLTPLADQQLGGIIMWVPGGLPYLAGALVLFVRLLSEPREPRATWTNSSVADPSDGRAAGSRAPSRVHLIHSRARSL